MRIYIETYGCSANLNNAEILSGILLDNNHKLVNSEKEADIVIINTCIVKGPTENKIVRRIKDVKKPLIVTGCMADAEISAIKKANKKAIALSSHRLSDVQEVIERWASILEKKHEVKVGLPKKNRSEVIEIIQINEGCLNNCAYCITKLAKGDLFSYPEDLIVEQVKKSKAKEIWITSQDCAAYGLDIGTNLPNLLRKISNINRDFKVRIGMANPHLIKRFLPELIEVLKDKHFFKFLHIPVQAGNDEVLKNMKRGYKAKVFSDIVEQVRKEIPGITIWTDIICGFPGETSEQFEDSLTLIEETKPDSIHINRFWPRRGTPAAKMKQIPVKEVQERTKRMMALFRKMAAEKKKAKLKTVSKKAKSKKKVTRKKAG